MAEPLPAPTSADRRPLRCFMDDRRGRAARAQPLPDDLAAIDAAADAATRWSPCSAGCSARPAGGVRRRSSTPTPRTPTRYIVHLSRPASACPTSPTTARTVRRGPRGLRRARRHDARAGSASAEPAEAAARIIALETALAAGHWDARQSRDAPRPTTSRPFADLPALAPGFDWAAWLEGPGRPRAPSTEVVVRQPDYLTAFAALLPARSSTTGGLAALARAPRRARSLLSATFVAENFDFYGRTLSRHRRAARAVEARRRHGRGRARRGRRPALRRPALPAGSQGADGRAGRQPRRGLPAQHQRLDWMGAETRRAGARQARTTSPRRSATRTRGATTRRWSIDRDDLLGNVPPRRPRSRSTASSPSSARPSTATSGS